MNFSRTALLNARKAGFHTFLAFWLTSALFVSPLLAGHQAFAHIHPQGTPYHVHALNALLSSEGAISQETIVTFNLLFLLSFSKIQPLYTPALSTGFLTRAPPLP